MTQETADNWTVDRLYQQLTSILPLLCLAVLFCAYAPAVLWSETSDRYHYSFWQLAPHLRSWSAITLTIFASCAIWFAPAQIQRILFALTFAFLIVALLEFGAFHTEPAAGDWRRWAITGLYGLIVVGCIVFRHSLLAPATLLLLAFLMWSGVTLYSLPEPNSKPQRDVAAIAEFSTPKNIIHIVLGGLQTTPVKSVLKNRTPGFRDKLKGFTFYDDHLRLYPATDTALGYFFTGSLWTNQTPLKNWHQSAGSNAILFSDLAGAGYGVDIVAPAKFATAQHRQTFRSTNIPTPFYADALPRAAKAGSATAAKTLASLGFDRAIPDSLARLAGWAQSKLFSKRTHKNHDHALA